MQRWDWELTPRKLWWHVDDKYFIFYTDKTNVFAKQKVLNSYVVIQVNVVFHLAATTRFDEPLRMATLINIRGTRETLLLGKACKNLR